MSLSRPYPSDLSPYWLESTFEIRQVLKNFAKRSEKVSVVISDAYSFLTVILDVTDRGELILDASGDARINQKAVGENGVKVHGVLDRVDIDFSLAKGRAIEYDGAPALQFMAPAKLHKLQRREFFRLPTPMVKPLLCSLFIAEEGEPKPREHQAQVLDISVGGICVQLPPKWAMLAGEVYKDCAMAIPEQGVIRFDLAVRHAFEVENRLGKKSRRAGCEFLNMPSSGQQAVQKFMTKLERDRRSVLN